MNDILIGKSIEEVLRLFQAFQFTDENEEVCPTNWIKGGKSVKTIPGDPDL